MPEIAELRPSNLANTGIAGLDTILGGGLTRERAYLVEGTPGTGKTTLALQFLLEGATAGERGLYITLSETTAELRAVAATHGWSLDGIELFDLVDETGLDPDREQSILHPAEVELGDTIASVIEQIERLQPSRMVLDSMSELRLLANNPLRYRRQILSLKQFLIGRGVTALMLDDRTMDTTDIQLHSIVHGVISLDQEAREFGGERRRVRVAKLRGAKFPGGYHDYVLDTGGLTVFPRLMSVDQRIAFANAFVSTGSAELDVLTGGGLTPGTSMLLAGPSGVGKTTTAMSCLLAAVERGERATFFLFDEGLGTLSMRCAALGMPLGPHLQSGQLVVRQIDPAELSPGQFAAAVRHEVEHCGVRFIVVDSLNAYLHAMPGETTLLMQLHELLNYLNQSGVTTFLVLAQHGVVGDVRGELDLSYVSDAVMLFRFFEARGELRTAVSVVKSRTSEHERTIREFRLGADGLVVGAALTDFQGLLTGIPSYAGAVPMLADTDPRLAA